MKTIIALLAAALLSIAPGPLLGQPATKRFAPEEVVNPAAFYPEGPQLHIRGIARCGNGEGSGCIARPRTLRNHVVRSRLRAHIDQADSRRGLLDPVPSRLIKLCGWMQHFTRVAHLSVLELRKANNVAKRCFESTQREISISARRVPIRWTRRLKAASCSSTWKAASRRIW